MQVVNPVIIIHFSSNLPSNISNLPQAGEEGVPLVVFQVFIHQQDVVEHCKHEQNQQKHDEKSVYVPRNVLKKEEEKTTRRGQKETTIRPLQRDVSTDAERQTN